jgi:hypothetical protein
MAKKRDKKKICSCGSRRGKTALGCMRPALSATISSGRRWAASWGGGDRGRSSGEAGKRAGLETQNREHCDHRKQDRCKHRQYDLPTAVSPWASARRQYDSRQGSPVPSNSFTTVVLRCRHIVRAPGGRSDVRTGRPGGAAPKWYASVLDPKRVRAGERLLKLDLVLAPQGREVLPVPHDFM